MVALVVATGTAARAPTPQSPCASKPTIHDAQAPADVRAYFQAKKAKVVTFFGYSGAGYEDEGGDAVAGARQAPRLRSRDNAREHRGDGRRDWRRLSGGQGAGLLDHGDRLEPGEAGAGRPGPLLDVVFYVTDTTWGGFADAKARRLSPTSQAMIENSDVLVAIGGGEVSRDEIQRRPEPGQGHRPRRLLRARDKGRPSHRPHPCSPHRRAPVLTCSRLHHMSVSASLYGASASFNRMNAHTPYSECPPHRLAHDTSAGKVVASLVPWDDHPSIYPVLNVAPYPLRQANRPVVAVTATQASDTPFLLVSAV